MTFPIQIQKTVCCSADPTPRTMQVAAMFGLALDATQQHTIVPPTRLTLCPGQIIYITGVSGGGKSTLLRLIREALTTDPAANDASPSAGRADRPGLIALDRLPALAEQALVDALAESQIEGRDASAQADFNRVCHWLSRAGLNDAAVMLRRPNELSEGQRHRLQLAQAMAAAENDPQPWSVLLADEFGSTLDRTTAKALARSVRRWVSGSEICFVAATAHDDLLEPMSPDVLIEVEPGGRCALHVRPG